MDFYSLTFTLHLSVFHPIVFYLPLRTPVITGFNTDIEYEGVVYHVQTEDKGLDSPLILSLVYSGGAILASKRSPYEDLIASGFDEEALAQRLKRQHRLICAAINAGRLEDLKRMGEKQEEKAADDIAALPVETASPDIETTPSPVELALPDIEIVSNASDAIVMETVPVADQDAAVIQDEIVTNATDYAAVLQAAPPTVDAPSEEESEVAQQVSVETSPYTVHDARRDSPLGDAPPPDGLTITILDEQDFWAGGSFHIRIQVLDRTNQQEAPVEGAALSVKVLGTGFRPQLYSVKTERDGVAVVSAQIPRFTSGRAAILIRAAALDGRSTEIRRVIHAAVF